MNRQLIIGSLIGIALGGLLTSSIARGMFSPPAVVSAGPAVSDVTESHATPDLDGLSGFDGAPPLRPGSARVGRPAAVPLAPELPIALDAHATLGGPTV